MLGVRVTRGGSLTATGRRRSRSLRRRALLVRRGSGLRDSHGGLDGCAVVLLMLCLMLLSMRLLMMLLVLLRVRLVLVALVRLLVLVTLVLLMLGMRLVMRLRVRLVRLGRGVRWLSSIAGKVISTRHICLVRVGCAGVEEGVS